ncbi:SusC/RagA family TonB-linked outer membrane protein [Arundinibacter roseus]|uniref:SusC/RagA family TonB-linked outer membrane protein n=1 Tax=Arundinibacter roseus TaxID=2070510 RepID=A0A4R4KLN0_9BACT|nr:SusC/RagA family TonB-linked outer membrane protein [Arundinibacter roseus]TDB67521.1 SusC/RagA family TonB-linked outer membrane protein [Arundinibacter roseus]
MNFYKTAQLLLLLLLGMSCSLVAQRVSVTGKVLDQNSGEPLAGTTILVRGTSEATLTDANGAFKIDVAEDAVLVASFIGFETHEVALAGRSSLTISLKENVNMLSELIVTGALGIRRSSKELGASAQVVGGDNLNQGKVINPLTGLSGKVSGLRINMYDSKVDPEIQISLRGMRSLSRSNGIDGRNPNAPIYVVDGVPIPSISRLNPNDIESITVLKGANAAALYGSEGVNGALMITTKSGQKGKGRVTISNTTTFSQVYLLPQAQTRFGQGINGVYSPAEYVSWGPEFDGTMKDFGGVLPDGSQPQMLFAAPTTDNRLGMFQTGLNQQNDVSFSGGDENGTYFLSSQYVKIKGIIPGDESDRINLRFNGTRRFGKLNTSYTVNYAHFSKSMTPDGPWITSYQLPANIDFSQFKDWRNPLSIGNPLNYFTAISGVRNPFFLAENFRQNAQQQVLNGKIELDYSFTPWLKAIYRVGLYSLSEETRNTTGKFAATGTRNVNGAVTDGTNSYRRLNSDFIVTATKDFGKFNTRLLLGQNLRTDDKKSTSIGSSNLLYPDLFNPDSRTGELSGSVALTQYRAAAAYGEFTAGYDNFLYLTFTGRNDWVSVLSPENRSYFYPGVSASFIASEALDFLNKSNTISFAKLYASWNKTGNVTLTPYQLNNAYSQANGFPFGNIIGFYPSLTNPNPSIKPEFVTSFETGFQLGLLNNRLNIDGAYVFSESNGQIFNANVSRATGYNTAYINAGTMTNDVVELGISGDVIHRSKLKWNLGFNFTYINNQVKELYDGATSRQNFRQSYAIIGRQYPTLIVTDYERDPQGRVVIDAATGNPLVAAAADTVGTLVPPYQMGISSSFKWKGLSLGLQFDWRMGGWMYSETIPRMYTAGTHPATVAYDRQPFIYPNSVIKTEDGTYEPNTSVYSAGDRAYWQRQGAVQSNTMAPSNFFKLRELNLSYNLPKALLGGQRFVREASIGFVATNLFIIRHKDNDQGDPEYLYNNTDGYSSFRQVPPYRTYGFNLNVSF